MFFKISVFIFFGEIPRSGMAESYDGSISNFLRHLHSVFHRGHSWSPANTAQGFSLLHSHQHLSLLLSYFSLIFLRISCTYGHMKYP